MKDLLDLGIVWYSQKSFGGRRISIYGIYFAYLLRLYAVFNGNFLICARHWTRFLARVDMRAECTEKDGHRGNSVLSHVSLLHSALEECILRSFRSGEETLTKDSVCWGFTLFFPGGVDGAAVPDLCFLVLRHKCRLFLHSGYIHHLNPFASVLCSLPWLT